MAQDDIQGTVVDSSGTAVSGAIVEVVPASTDGSTTKETVVRTTTDSNGNYIIDYHPNSDGTTQDWHVTAYNWDGSNWVPALNKPGVSADLGSAIPDSGISRWTYDNADTDSGTALDVWDANDGTINGATTGASGANQTYTTNEAYSFDGSDDYVNAGDIGDPTDTFSVAFWMYPDNISSSNTYPFEYAESTGSFPTWYYRFEQDTDISNGNCRAGVRDGGGSVYNIPGTITQGAWNHVVLARRGTEFEFYVDATSQGTASPGTGTLYTSGSVFLTGRRGNGNYWAGDIDDPRVYSKGLSDTEVSNLYNTGSI